MSYDPDYDDHDDYNDDGDGDQNVGSSAEQHMLLSYLASQRNLWIRCAPVIKEEYFDAAYKPVVRLFREFEVKNQTMPDPMIVRADTGIDLGIPSDSDNPLVQDEVCQRVEEFCRLVATQNFLLEAADVIQEDRTKATLMFLAKEMDEISTISVTQNLGYEVHDSVRELLEIAEKADGQPTDMIYMDEALNGGVTDPSLNLISAGSGQGKSVMLQNLAINYMRQGHNVCYISLELPEYMIQKRITAMATNININELYRNRDVAVAKMQQSKRREGKLQIKRMPISGTTVAHIRSYVNELSSTTGLEWKHVMIDYMDLMTPIKTGIKADNIHVLDKAISQELYDYAHDRVSSKIIWTASQQVKGAMDEKDGRQGAISGGTDKVNTSDNAIILKRTVEDIKNQMCWAYVVKGRNGGTGIRFPIYWNGGTQRMICIEDHRELFVEANTGGGSGEKKPEEQRSRLQNDPFMKASRIGATDAHRKAAELREKIANRAGAKNAAT